MGARQLAACGAACHRQNATPPCQFVACLPSLHVQLADAPVSLLPWRPAAGFRSTRRTKLICTIGPSCDSEEMLDLLAQGGMNVARLNMAHGGWDLWPGDG